MSAQSARKPGRPRRPLNAQAIAVAAIRIADAEGLDAVSIRRIASELDARPMSLYDYFASKGELLSAMAEEVVAEVLLPGALPRGWRAAVTALAHRYFAYFLRHPWLPILFGRGPAWGSSATRVSAQAAAAIADMPVGPDERWTLFGTVLDYVLGHSLRAVAAPEPAAYEALIPPSELAAAPELASLPANMRSRGELERFQTGLELVLNGIETRLTEAE